MPGRLHHPGAPRVSLVAETRLSQQRYRSFLGKRAPRQPGQGKRGAPTAAASSACPPLPTPYPWQVGGRPRRPSLGLCLVLSRKAEKQTSGKEKVEKRTATWPRGFQRHSEAICDAGSSSSAWAFPRDGPLTAPTHMRAWLPDIRSFLAREGTGYLKIVTIY